DRYRSGKKMMKRALIGFVALCSVSISVVLVSPATHWDGAFPLSIDVVAVETVDRNSITYYQCWSEVQARWICEYHPESAVDFRLPAERDDNSDRIFVEHSGTRRFFGMIATYQRPPKLCVQFDVVRMDRKTRCRKAIAIPRARDQRSLTLNLP
ncbi:hypothetical protein, partial [Roseiconus lacunae]|uniref:hypothetical protein n=1 Tax=Roseiconus lacunae TaxID=2605694 RepID=UPI00193F7294